MFKGCRCALETEMVADRDERDAPSAASRRLSSGVALLRDAINA